MDRLLTLTPALIDWKPSEDQTVNDWTRLQDVESLRGLLVQVQVSRVGEGSQHATYKTYISRGYHWRHLESDSVQGSTAGDLELCEGEDLSMNERVVEMDSVLKNT